MAKKKETIKNDSKEVMELKAAKNLNEQRLNKLMSKKIALDEEINATSTTLEVILEKMEEMGIENDEVEEV